MKEEEAYCLKKRSNIEEISANVKMKKSAGESYWLMKKL